MMDYPFSGKKYAFTVCRIEPENSIHIILQAFAKDAAIPLVIVGNWTNSDYGRNLKKQFGSHESIHLLDPIYDLNELNKLRKGCTIYLHGHSCGGTNPSLVEAMYLGLVIVAFDVNFNRETTENKALYFSSAEQLNKICSELEESTCNTIASSMKEIAERRYTWKRISECYAELF